MCRSGKLRGVEIRCRQSVLDGLTEVNRQRASARCPPDKRPTHFWHDKNPLVEAGHYVMYLHEMSAGPLALVSRTRNVV